MYALLYLGSVVDVNGAVPCHKYVEDDVFETTAQDQRKEDGVQDVRDVVRQCRRE